jgi:hypothetical protein
MVGIETAGFAVSNVVLSFGTLLEIFPPEMLAVAAEGVGVIPDGRIFSNPGATTGAEVEEGGLCWMLVLIPNENAAFALASGAGGANPGKGNNVTIISIMQTTRQISTSVIQTMETHQKVPRASLSL